MDVRTGSEVKPMQRPTGLGRVWPFARLGAVAAVRYRKTVQGIHRFRCSYVWRRALRKEARVNPAADAVLRDLEKSDQMIDQTDFTKRLQEIQTQGLLSEIEWTVIELRTQRGLTYQQIAAELNMETPDVFGALARSYSKLRMQLMPVN